MYCNPNPKTPVVTNGKRPSTLTHFNSTTRLRGFPHARLHLQQWRPRQIDHPISNSRNAPTLPSPSPSTPPLHPPTPSPTTTATMTSHLRPTPEMLNVFSLRRWLKNFANSPSTFQILRSLPYSDARLTSLPRTLYVLDSSFNPPTRARKFGGAMAISLLRY